MRRSLLFLFALTIIMLLTACAPGGTTPGDDNILTTSSPTPSPTPAPFTDYNDDVVFSLKYPTGWAPAAKTSQGITNIVFQKENDHGLVVAYGEAAKASTFLDEYNKVFIPVGNSNYKEASADKQAVYGGYTFNQIAVTIVLRVSKI